MKPVANGAGDGRLAGRRIAFFEKHYTLDAEGMLDDGGDTPTRMMADLIRRYLAAPPVVSATCGNDWCTFRELRGAGPLAVHFAANTHKTIAAAFGGDLPALDRAAAKAGGLLEAEAGFDRRYFFQALPEVSLVLYYNAPDDLFSAQANLLFQRSARNLLDIRDLFALGTYLTARLVVGAGHSA
jgi:hypothetical protein